MLIVADAAWFAVGFIAPIVNEQGAPDGKMLFLLPVLLLMFKCCRLTTSEEHLRERTSAASDARRVCECVVAGRIDDGHWPARFAASGTISCTRRAVLGVAFADCGRDVGYGRRAAAVERAQP